MRLMSKEPSRGPSRGRAWRYFRLITINVLVTVVLVEAISYIVMLVSGEGLSELHAQLKPKGKSALIEAGRQHRHHVLHPYFGYTYSPYKDETHGAGLPINPHGFLGEGDILTKNAEDDFNVVIVGGSVANNFLVHNRTKLPARLKELPALRGKKVNVFAFTAGGYHQPQQLLIINYYLSCYGAKVDLLINIDGYNEITVPYQHRVYSAKSMFYPYQGEFFADRMTNPEVRMLTGLIAYRDSVRQRRIRWFNSSLLRYSATATLLISRSDRNHEQQTMEQVAELKRKQLVAT